MNRRTFLAAAGVGATVTLAGCLDGTGEATRENTVEMTMSRFRPEELTVDAGTTVEFINTSSHAHTVTMFEGGYTPPEGEDPDDYDPEYFASGGFDNHDDAYDDWHSTQQDGQLLTNESYEHTFEVPGTYNYYCIPHIDAEMVGTIVVEE